MKISIVTIHQAKTNLSRLIRRTAQGQEVIIARGAKPVAHLVPIGVTEGRRKPGSMKGKLVIRPEFFEPLPATEVSGWE